MLSEIIKTFLLAMTPVGELRAAIPVAITVYKLHWAMAYFIAVLGNLAPAIFLLLFLEPVVKFLTEHSKIFAKFFNWLFKQTRQRIGDRIHPVKSAEGGAKQFDGVNRRGWLALIPFVAVPLPVTGAWAGSVAAFLLKIPFRRAFPAITAGVLLAGVIVSLATGAGIVVEQYFGWQVLIVASLITVVIGSIYKFMKIKH